MTITLERAIGGGESQVSYGSGERPRHSALARTIDQFYADLQPPLADLREAVFAATQLPEVEKAEGGPVFRYTAKLRRILDAAITKFLDTVAGPDRTRAGYVNGGAQSDQSDGILQQRQILAYSVGLRRAADLVGTAQTLVPSRQDPAVKEMLNGAFSRLSTGGALRLESVRDDIHGVLVGGADAGLSPLDVGRQLSKQFDNYSGYEFERLARTESAFASEAGNREQMMEFGVQFVTWLLAAGACPICQAYEGQIIPIDDEDNQPPAHPNCCLPGTVVTGPRALASTTRWSSGEVVSIQTRRGRFLTVTPNHPILTSKGWVAAGLLREGDEVICGSRLQGVSPSIRPDDYQIPALIEDVAATLGSARRVTARSVPTAAEDFHGDGGSSEVCVIRTNRKLGNGLDAASHQPFAKKRLCGRHAEALVLSRLSASEQFILRTFFASDGFMRRQSHSRPLFGAPTGREAILDLASTMGGDFSLPQKTSHGSTANPDTPSNRELIFAGEVTSDHIVFVNRFQFAGHVFNLQTEFGWFIANNIITHNCMCTATPYLGGLT
jgi:hypothetical protein